MPLYLSNHDQEQCIDTANAMGALEDGLKQFARGAAIRRPRIDNFMPTSRPGEMFCFSSMEGTVRSGYHALRIKPDVISWPIINGRPRRQTYNTRPGVYGGLVLLFGTEHAEFLAVMNDGYIQHLRTGCTGGLGIKFLARADSRVMGILGAGGMARSFALAAAAVRPIQRIQVYSPTRANVESFCAEMRIRLGCEVVMAESPEDAAGDTDILSSCTNSITPVIQPHMIHRGQHLTNVSLWEISPEAYARIETAGVLVQRSPMRIGTFEDDDFGLRTGVLSYAGGTAEERATIPTIEHNPNRFPNAQLVDCCNWETGAAYCTRRQEDEVTTLVTASHGTLEGEGGGSAGIQGLQFAAVAGRIYERARALGVGTDLPADMFLQDVPT